MSGKGQGRETLPALRSLGPVEPPPWERATEKEKGPFEKRGKVARSPPAALTPPPSEGFLEESSSGAAAFFARTMSSNDRTLVNLLARMGEVQRVMVAQHGEFQVSLSGVLKSHDDQLAAQVTTQQNMVQQMGEFHQVVGDALTSQAESQRLMSEQLRVMQEQLDALRTQGQGRAKADRGPLKLKMFDGMGDPDAHIHHYEAVGKTEKWSDEDMKTGFHRTLKDMALQWYERRVESIH